MPPHETSLIAEPHSELSGNRRVQGRVLVLDDAGPQRDGVAAALRDEGLEVAESTCGEEAVVAARDLIPDVVVVDVCRTDIAALDMCRRLKGAAESILPVLHLSSAESSSDDRARGLDAGADAYLARPFDANELRAAVSALLRFKHQEIGRIADKHINAILRSALDALDDNVALLGPNGEVVAVNRAWSDFASANGYADSSAGLGANYCEICEVATGAGADEGRAVAVGVRQVLAGESESFEIDYQCNSPTKERWYHLVVRRVAHSGTVAAIATHTDRSQERLAATARAEAERSLHETEARFRRYVEIAHEGVLATDGVGVITYANPRVAALLRYTTDELLTMRVFDVMEPNQAFEARSRFASQQRGLSTTAEAELQRRDGELIPVLIASSPMNDANGTFIGMLAVVSDITHQKLAEHNIAEALAEADLDRRRLGAILEAIPVGVLLCDADGKVTHTNPAAVKIWGGRAPHVAIGDYDLYRATWPETGDQVANEDRALARALQGGEAVSGLLMDIVRFDGTSGHLLNSAAPILDAERRITGGVVVSVDVTERQVAVSERERLLASLEAERSRLAAIFQEAPAFLAVLRGPTYVFDRTNPAYMRLVGNRDILGKPLLEALPELHDQGFVALLDQVRISGTPFHGRRVPVVLARMPDAAPETRYVDMVYQLITDVNGDSLILAHGVDVTEQVIATEAVKEAEQLLRDRFAKLPIPTYLWKVSGDDFELIDVNEAAMRSDPRLGENPIGRLRREIFPGFDFLAGDFHTSLRDNIVIHRHVDFDVADGAPENRSFDLTIGPQPPDRVLVHALDTTQRSELEAQLRQVMKMEAVGQLAGGVAHDFNNILTVIGAHSSFLLESLDSHDFRREDVEEIHKASVRAAGLTRQLLAFGRKQILKPTSLNLNEVIVNTLKLLKRLLGEDVEINTQLAADLGSVTADASQVDQVLINLAVNARDAMPSGGQLTIRTENCDIQGDRRGNHLVPSGDYVLLAVSDRGVGMTEEVQARLFEPFFTTKGPGKGTGLGLATVYGIIKQSGGYIHVDSIVAEGTTFCIYLPRGKSEELAVTQRVAESAARGGVETILLVEDEPAVREIAKRVLKRQGYIVLEASSANEAIAVSAAFKATIHLVISDAVMPGLSAAEGVLLLKAKRPDIKVIFMSGYTDDDVVRRGIISSAMPFIQKPFTPSDLSRVVRETLDSRDS